MNYSDAAKFEKQVQNELTQKKRRLYSKYSMQRLLHQHAEEMFKHVGSTDSVLDVGCGMGDLVLLARKYTNNSVLGIDVSDKCIEIARGRIADANHNTEVLLADIQDLHLQLPKNGAFDRVLMKGVVHHLASPSLSFRNVFEMLHSEGALVILEGNVSSAYRRLMLALADTMGFRHEASQFPHLPPGKIEDILRDVGFKTICVRYVSGAFAPFAYAGLGGPGFWKIADRIESACQLLAPRLFGWWMLIVASKC